MTPTELEPTPLFDGGASAARTPRHTRQPGGPQPGRDTVGYRRAIASTKHSPKSRPVNS